jgi:hypothetical protein
MTDDELVAEARQARQNAHGAWRNVDGNRATDWCGAARRLFELVQEAERRKIDMCLIFGDRSHP